jgi:hypothetical protein
VRPIKGKGMNILIQDIRVTHGGICPDPRPQDTTVCTFTQMGVPPLVARRYIQVHYRAASTSYCISIFTVHRHFLNSSCC